MKYFLSDCQTPNSLQYEDIPKNEIKSIIETSLSFQRNLNGNYELLGINIAVERLAQHKILRRTK